MKKTMKTILKLALTAMAALAFTACGGGSGGNSAVNKEPALRSEGPPKKETLMTLEKSAYEAWKSKDAKFWDTFLSEQFVGLGSSGRLHKATAIREYTREDCQVTSFELTADQMTPMGLDAAVVTYKATVDATCGGKKNPPITWAASVYVREDDKWKGVFHGEIAPLNPESPPSKIAAKPSATEQPADPLTTIMRTAEKKIWDAWKARDANAIEPFLMNEVTMVDATGRYDRAGTLRAWFKSKCEIESYELTEPIGVPLSKTAGLLLFNASAAGTCEGQPLGRYKNVSGYVIDEDSLKMAFSFLSPA